MKRLRALNNDRVQKIITWIKMILPWAFILFSLAIIVFGLFVMQTPVMLLVKAALFGLCGLLLPGYLLARSTSGDKGFSELFSQSMLAGIAFNLCAYFLDAYIPLPFAEGEFFSRYLGLVLCVPSVVLLVMDIRKKRLKKESLLPGTGITALMLFVLAISFCSISLKGAVPANILGSVNGYHDVLWNVSNTAAFDQSWPAVNMQYAGRALNSNCFAFLFRVGVMRFTGATAAQSSMWLAQFYLVPLMVFSLDSLGAYYLGGKRRSLFYTFGFIFVAYASSAFIFLQSVENAYSASYYAYFMNAAINTLYAPNGIDLAIPALALLALQALRIYRESKLTLPDCVALLLIAMVATGAKYVFTLCLLGALVGTMILRLLQGKGYKSLKTAGVVTLIVAIGFAAPYLGVVKGGKLFEPAARCQAEFSAVGSEEYRQASRSYIAALNGGENARSLLVAGEIDDAVYADGAYYLYASDADTVVMNELAEEDILSMQQSDAGLFVFSDIYAAAERPEDETVYDQVYVIDGADCMVFYPEDDSAASFCFFGPEVNVRGYSPLATPKPDVEPVAEYAYNVDYSSVSPGSIMKDTAFFKALTGGTTLTPAQESIYMLLLIPVHFLLQMPFFALPFILWVVGRLKRFKSISKADMLLCGTSICGLIVFYMIDVDGLSQSYFYFAASIFICLIATEWLVKNKRALKPAAKCLLSFALIVAVSSSCAYYAFYAKAGLYQAKAALTGELLESKSGANSMTAYEYEAMEWLRENTPEDAVIAVDRHYYIEGALPEHPEPNDGARYFYFTAYSERHAFLGGWAYLPRTVEMQQMLEERLKVNDALFDAFCSNKREIMEAHNISYIVDSNYVGINAPLEGDDLVVAFRNRDITIYALSE